MTRSVARSALSDDYIAPQAARELAAIAQRPAASMRRGGRPSKSPAGLSIVVDDGVATGMTMQAALRSVRRRQPAKLIAAVPVASREALAMLRREADDVVCLNSPGSFGSVGSFYRDFEQVSDAEVVELLKQRRG